MSNQKSITNEPLPSWYLIVLLGCIERGSVCLHSFDHKNGLNNPPEASTSIVKLEDLLSTGHPIPLEVQKQEAQKLLDAYLNHYEKDELVPLDDYKTFRKSLECTISFLEQMEESKGRQFLIHKQSPNYPDSDVRLYTDLIYLQQKGFLQFPELENITAIDQEVDKLFVKLLVAAEDIASALIPVEPDAVYRDLQFFGDEGQLVYHTHSDKIDATKISMRLLLRMMQEKGPWPLKELIREFKVKTTIKAPKGENSVQGYISTIEKHLERVHFPYRLGIKNQKIVWKIEK